VTLILSPERWRAADLNSDCEVDQADLGILLDHWEVRGSPADLDGSGVVGFQDLLLARGLGMKPMSRGREHRH
jgi:hypothetical protein